MLDFDFIRNNWLFIATGIGATLGISIFSFLLAAPVGAIVATGRRSTFLPIKAISSLYVLLIDGIPLYLQIFFIFFALPQLGVIIPGFNAALLVLTVNYSSRISEVFYGIFGSEGKGQDKTLISWIQPFANEFSNIIKDSALLSATGFIHEIMWRATRVGLGQFKYLEAFLIAAIIYLILITAITVGVKPFKLRTAKSGSGIEATLQEKMVNEAPPDVHLPTGAFAPEQISQLLPLIRTVRRRVIALYKDALLVGTLKSSARITEEMCSVSGRPQLLAILSNPREIPLSEIRTIQTIAPLSPFENSGCRIKVETATERIRFKLSSNGATNILFTLEQLLPGRVNRRISVWKRLSWRTLGLIALSASGLTAMMTFPSSLVGVFSAAIFGVVLILYVYYTWYYRSKKPSRDLSGISAYHNRPLGWVVKLVSLAIFAFVFLSALDDSVSGLLFAAGAVAMYYGYQMSLLEPTETDLDESSRPIFYLRAFDDDNRTNLQPTGLLAKLQGLPIGDVRSIRSQNMAYLYPIRLLRMFFNLGMDTSEEQLAHFFRKHGPFLAIGKPGETFSSPGALRIYVGNDKWQDTVLEILERCKAVVLQPAKTRGIWWEVEQVLKLVKPQRILMCLVNFKGQPDDYEQFRLKIEPMLPVKLPRAVPYLDQYAFLYFETDWTPRLQMLHYRSPFMWGLIGDATDLESTLGPFMQGVEGQSRPLPIMSKEYRLQKAIATLLLLLFNGLLILLVLANLSY